MRRDTLKLPILSSSFLSCEKDTETILRKLFIECEPCSRELKKLLVINTKDCLDNPKYNEKIKEYNLGRLIKDGYVKLSPKMNFEEHEEVKAILLFSFDNFVENKENPEFRDCVVSIDIICNTDYWDLGDYRLRPLKIAGYIDAILDNSRLSGIGTFQFFSCNELILNEELSGYTLSYLAIHGTDDRLEGDED